MNYDFLWTGLLIFTILWAFSEIKKWLSHRNIKDTTSFQLTANENNEWRRTQAKAVTIEKNIKKLDREIQSLKVKGSGLRKNKQGKFDNRSALGKKLNKSINNALVKKLRYDGDLAKARTIISELEDLERLRSTPWIASESRRLAARILTLLFAGTSLFFLVFNIKSGGMMISIIILVGLIGYWLTHQSLRDAMSKKLGY